MRTEKEVRDLLKKIEVDEDFHTVIIKDVGVAEIKTAKEMLRWFLNE